VREKVASRTRRREERSGTEYFPWKSSATPPSIGKKLGWPAGWREGGCEWAKLVDRAHPFALEVRLSDFANVGDQGDDGREAKHGEARRTPRVRA
jgi:hypothetical protein